MSKSRTDLMGDSLRDLQASTPDVEASAIVSVDGLIIASSLAAGVEEDRASAMSAAMLSLGERIAGELGRGVLDQVYIWSSFGFQVVVALGSPLDPSTLRRGSGRASLRTSSVLWGE